MQESVDKMLQFAEGKEIDVAGKVTAGKKRNFTETVELQIGACGRGAARRGGARCTRGAHAMHGRPRACAHAQRATHVVAGLKNYDPAKDKRFSGAFQLPYVPRPHMKVCVLANAKHADEAKAIDMDFRTVDDLKALNKNKKLIKKLGAFPWRGRSHTRARWCCLPSRACTARSHTRAPAAKKYDAFLASDTLIKQIPRLLGPGLNRAGKFPTLVNSNEDLTAKADSVKATIKFQVRRSSGLSRAGARGSGADARRLR